jgi:5-methylthioadenosine/S-adenosylhomocysteine deaminase
VWASPADVQLLAATGAMVVHNPSSNLILGSGIAPVAELLDAGVPVGFGQDGADFNDQQDMFTDLRLGLRLQRQPVWGRREVTAMDMLAMATRGGAPALGLSHSIGRLEEGYQADLVLLDRTRLYGSPYVSPSEPPEEIVLRRACADDVDHVLVAGEPRIQEGRVVGIDEPALQRRLTASLKRTYEQLPSIDRLYEQLEPYISDFYARWTSDPPALTLA